MSQWPDLEITLQMAFGRARGDFSRPQSDPGIIVYIALIFYISQTLDPKPSFQENLTFKETLIFHSSRKMRNALVYRLVSIRILSARANAKLHNKEFGNLAFEAFWRWYLFPICIHRSYFVYCQTLDQKNVFSRKHHF